jgi:hypothetical protein
MHHVIPPPPPPPHVPEFVDDRDRALLEAGHVLNIDHETDARGEAFRDGYEAGAAGEPDSIAEHLERVQDDLGMVLAAVTDEPAHSMLLKARYAVGAADNWLGATQGFSTLTVNI